MNSAEQNTNILPTSRKALNINLDPIKYGTFAEIGAGQEVARYFFKVGGAAGTVAKSMSAYDMKFSDDIYGKAPRYVSKERLIQMLDHEFELLDQRLTETRGEKTTFFAYANTVAALNYKGTNNCHGWMGVKYQLSPLTPPVQVLVHVRMLDRDNALQQDALGTFGVNLIHAAFNLHHDHNAFIDSLTDNIADGRIEVDMIQMKGDYPTPYDNRILSLLLVKHGLSDAIMFNAQGEVAQPSAMLYKKNVLIHRGSFRPFTKVNLDMVKNAATQFVQTENMAGDVIEVMELTMHNLLNSNADHRLDLEDFLSRIDSINSLEYPVMVSNYFEYYRLSAYVRSHSSGMIGMALGINSLLEIFNEEHYYHLDGGILESIGRLFKSNIKLYIYPMEGPAYSKYLELMESRKPDPKNIANIPDDIRITAKNLQLPSKLRNLYDHLVENKFIEAIQNYNEEYMNIFSREVLNSIRRQETQWEQWVPQAVANIIKDRQLWGYTKESS